MVDLVSKKKVFLSSLLLFLVFGFGCTKRATGPKGDPGTPGGKGTLKRIKNFEVTVDTDSWKAISSTGWEYVVNVPEISAQALNEIAVDVYYKTNNELWRLPYETSGIFTHFITEQGAVKLMVDRVHGIILKPVTGTFRIVVYTKTSG